jgi:hypothetical protein
MGISLVTVQDIIASEYLLRKDFYATFGITEDDLQRYLCDHNFSLPSVDAVVNFCVMQPTPQQLSLASSIYTNRILLIQQ